LSSNSINYNGTPLPFLSKGSLTGVNLCKFDRKLLSTQCAELSKQLGIDNSDYFIFSFIARKTIDKGALDILLAFSKVRRILNNCKLLFIGPDEDGEISRLRLTNPSIFADVIEVDKVSNHETYLGITNLLCLPSYREGFGTIVIDAAAMGVPAIGSRISGLTDAIEDGFSGLLFNPGDINEISFMMVSLANDHDKCALMGIQAKKRVENLFNADLLYNCLRDLYLNLVNNSYNDR
jgi:glycosyltransferase involved in cell wall biosynthesis